MNRKAYLSMKSLQEAKELFFSRIDLDKRISSKIVRVEEALHRVTAAAVFAERSAPAYHSAAMDGIAVKAEKTYGTNERQPRILKLGQDAVWINTGNPLPEMFDSVIMVEKIHQLDDDHLEIRSPSYPWQHVRKLGEDIVATELLLPQNHRIRSCDIGALVSAGVFEINVWQRPKVVIIPSGSELVNHRDLKKGGILKKGQIIESNSLILAGLVRESGGVPIVYDIVPDKKDRLREALTMAVESEVDVVIINAGSSAGSRDYTVDIIKEKGEVLVHGVAIMPGKPTVLGVVEGKPVVGNPGYPVSASISFDNFVNPLLFRLQGLQPSSREVVKVRPTRDIPSKPGIEEFLRVHIGKVGSDYVATPLARAAGSITTLTRAEGIIRIPALSEGLSQNKQIDAELFVSRDELENTIMVIGSHDISLDILADEIRHKGYNIRVSSGNVGSLGGLMAIRKGSCHMAGSHLLDPGTGQYNISYIARFIKGVRVSVFHLVLRDQGLIVQKGNPKGIKGIKDLKRNDIAYVNRQIGSGTRVLFDYKLEQTGVLPESIRGYNHEEFTHMAVAVDILSGSFDCGMGIFAAAKALDLDFIPVVQEQYDLIVPNSILDKDSIKIVFDTIRSRGFRDRIKALGGYDSSMSGDFWKEVYVDENC
jgi:putative molybdopterin biosynthesis protein